MKPFEQFPIHQKKHIRFILTDIDDTLTLNGRLPADVFVAMERLKTAEIRIIPITGRPAGWCDHIARMWPVDGLVGENGAFYFWYDEAERKIQRRYYTSQKERRINQQKHAGRLMGRRRTNRVVRSRCSHSGSPLPRRGRADPR